MTHGLCPKHFEVSLREIKADVEKMVKKIRNLRVLIVEDNTRFREQFTSILNKRFASIEFHGAGDGKEALQKVETMHPNLIFMDIGLPGENGLELTRKIKASHPHIVVFILTNYDFPEYRERATLCGADYFFSKGSSATENIFRLIESILPSPA